MRQDPAAAHACGGAAGPGEDPRLLGPHWHNVPDQGRYNDPVKRYIGTLQILARGLYRVGGPTVRCPHYFIRTYPGTSTTVSGIGFIKFPLPGNPARRPPGEPGTGQVEVWPTAAYMQGGVSRPQTD